MALADDLEQAATAAASHGRVSAVLAAEPASFGRSYLVALGEGDDRRWLVLDAELRSVELREHVRAVASIVVLCELAGELAGGGALEELRAHLSELRATGAASGLGDVEQAARALELAVGMPPVLASPAYLDDVGTATRGLEAALGERVSPFANALASSSGTIEAFVAEVDTWHVFPLR